MKSVFGCDDKQTLIAYVYGEVDPATRAAVDAHVAACRACADEISGLGDARAELGLWAAPDVDLDFAIVKKSALPPANVLHPAQWWNTVPVWAQAAAAILVVAAGLSVANLQVRSGADGFVVTTGWMTAPPPIVNASSPRDTAAPGAADWKPALTALEQQLRNEIKASREQETRVVARGPVDDATVRRVEQLISDAEQRQQHELAARFIDFMRDVNMQRRADMQKLSNVVGAYDERLLQQRQMINNVYRVSTTPQQ